MREVPNAPNEVLRTAPDREQPICPHPKTLTTGNTGSFGTRFLVTLYLVCYVLLHILSF